MKYRMNVHRVNELNKDIVELEEDEIPLNIMTHPTNIGICVVELFTLKKVKG